MIAFLKTLQQLHSAGVVHRDLTPKNVLVCSGGCLKIADFGIAGQSLKNRGVRFDAFNPDFAPPIFERWLAADDVFHCGQVYAFLLAGRADALLNTEDVRKLKCSPEAKAVIQRCIGARRRRYESAAEMLNALQSLGEGLPRPGNVRSLVGKRVVFTGRMRVVRAQARRALTKAGGIPQAKVGHQTDILVRGEQSSPLYKAVEMGQKLLDVQREREAGHDVVELPETRFWRLCEV
jgi:Protein kinase domain